MGHRAGLGTPHHEEKDSGRVISPLSLGFLIDRKGLMRRPPQGLVMWTPRTKLAVRGAERPPLSVFTWRHVCHLRAKPRSSCHAAGPTDLRLLLRAVNAVAAAFDVVAVAIPGRSVFAVGFLSLTVTWVGCSFY